MKLTKQIEAEVLDVYEAYWGSLLNVDMETYDAVLDNNFRLIGTTESEVFFKKMEAIRFLKATADQVAGNIELRNRIIKVEPVDKLILITEESDAYALIDDVWTFYAKTRTSALAQKKDDGWKFVQMHISFPDNRAEEGEAIALEKISKENLELRDAVKRRTVELEAKSRELEIEAALEKVRSRSLAMQQSEELMEVVAIVFEKFRELNMQADGGVGIAIFNDETKGIDYWAANPDYISASRFITPYFDHPINNDIWTARDSGTNFLTNTYSLKEKNSWWNYLLKHTDFKNLPGDNKKMILESKSMTNAIAMSKNSAVVVATYLEKSFSEEQIEIVKRFETVFDQAYTRFLDLKKAEAQAREAQIEAALERVRSRTMAMQKTDELLEAAELVSKELSALGVTSMNVSYAFVDEKEKNAFYYSLNPVDGKIAPFPFVFPHTETKVMRSILSSWKKQEPFNVIELDEKATLKHQTWVGEHIQKQITESNIDMLFSVEAFLAVSPKKAVLYTFNFAQGYLFNIGGERLTSMQEEMLLRFTKVFDMTYRRFLDLKQAEQQAREAQIELALERVRARTMAMQRSDELSETAAVLFQEFKKLGEEDILQITIGIYNEAEGVIEFNVTSWAGGGEQVNRPFNLSIEEPTLLKPVFTAWKQQKKSIVVDLTGKKLEGWLKYRNANTGTTVRSSDTGGRRVIGCAFFSKGHISISSPEPKSPETIQLLERFAGVFDLTYTRFLDLKNAEAQTRESQIELGLERVRARAMAMQNSDELKELIGTVFIELTKLDLVLTRCLIMIYDTKTNGSIWWMANSEAPTEPIGLYVKNHQLSPYAAYIKAWKERKNKWQYILEGKDKNDWDDFLFTETELSQLPDFVIAGMKAPDRVCLSASFNNFGCLNLASLEPLSDEHFDILLRFAKVFDLTYTRFNDLQKAEAQAREAQIELGLERVRARAMAMQKSGELSELVDTVFKELTKLDFALTWCIINIIDESSMSNTVWAANPDINKPPESYHMLFEDYPFHHAMLKGWKERKTKHVYTLEGSEKKIYDDYLFSETEFKRTPEAAQAASRAMEKYVVSFSFSNFGGLQTVGDVPLSDANLDILSRFGKVFDLTYTRFNDLKQAEEQARESQIQLAMERVRARTMAMQRSEELADVATVLFQQVKALGVPQWTCGFNIWELGDKEYTFYPGSPDGDILPPCKIPLTEHWVFSKMDESRKRGEEFYMYEKEGKQREEHYRYMLSVPGGLSELLQNMLSAGMQIPTFQIDHFANFSHGNLMFITYEPVPEMWDVFKRFAKVFEQTYTRFLDLQKSEAQARESQIQLAMERVRARTMAMQKSEELGEAASLLFKQIADLGTKQWSSGFDIWNANEVSAVAWMSNPDGSMGKPFSVPYTEDTFFKQIYEAKQSGNDFFVMESSGKELEETYQYLFNLPDAKKHFDGVESLGFQMPTFQITHCAFFAQGYLMFITYEPCPEMWDIFKRFAKVFEQTYTRFLDLQKSEAQARESQIQLAMERVRARTMAMQRSEELADVATVLFQQVKALGVPQWTCGFNIWEIGDTDFTFYPGSPDGDILPPCKVPLTEDPVFILFDESRRRGDELCVYESKGEIQEAHYRYMHSLKGGLGDLLQGMLDAGFKFPTFQIDHIANFSNGNLLFITYEHFPEMHDIFKRFAKVFEQTYTRFLDLQKAEAQAREAKIEAALEKVRSRTMAMQRSAELAEAATVLFQQVKALGVPQWTCGFSIFEIDDKEFTWYPGSADGDILPPIKIPLTEHPVFISFNESRKRCEELFVYEKGGEFQADHYRYMRSLPGGEEMYQNTLKAGLTFPTFQIDHIANFSHGNLVFITYEHFPEMHDVFKRFAKVFEQTYTRFLDLQKAEAQTRQAQIETAMEKVRARALAMQKPEELVEVAEVLRKEMGLLGVEELETGSIYIHDETSGNTECWYAIKKIQDDESKLVTDHMIIKLQDTWVGRQMLEFYKSDKKQISIPMQGDNRKEWIHYCTKHSTTFDGFYGENIPDRTYHLNKFSNGYIGAASPGDISAESWDLLQRATSVFSLAYTRFSDLQIAEASTREAIRRASLDRIRAEIASMRTMNDLQRITPLIWNELTTLNIPFIRCGVFIMDESQKFIHTFLSTPDGKAIGAFHLPYDTPGNIRLVLKNWQDKKNYIDHWDKEAFIEFADTLIKQGALTSTEQYLSTIPHGGFYLHFLPFLQGMLYVGNTTQLGDDEIKLIQSVADAFSTAYARYEDFNKLEAAKEQIENTLINLKQTQAQLIQSEKMASLGELTAGIAHEIQNPLNFVNNFSDVSTELVDEMNAEIEKGNLEDAKQIAEDLKQNLEKINHHGKRAGDIVKGMLQHSRSSSATKEPTDINKLADEYLRLAYHGLRAKDKTFNATMKTEFDESIGTIDVIPQDIGRVILNLITNAFYVVAEKKKQNANGFEPTVSVTTKKINDKIEVSVIDNGSGIPQKVLDKIFQPFFTTKPTGQGTGLGLSLSYDIVKAHGGEIKVETKENEGTEFIIQLPTG